MKLIVVDSQDYGGTGGALRGQEIAFALHKMGHEVRDRSPREVFSMHAWDGAKPDAVIFTGTWHQLVLEGKNGLSHVEHCSQCCDEDGVATIWWYGSNGSVFGANDPDAAKRKASEQKIIDKICSRHFIAVICPYSMGIYQRHGLPAEKMRLVPSVFDGDLFCPSQSAYDDRVTERLRYRFRIPESAYCMGTIGNTPNSKGGNDVLKAFALLKDRMPDLMYIILHSPSQVLSKVKAKSPDGKKIGLSEWDVLQESRILADNLGIGDRCRFIGTRFPRHAMPAFYRMLQIYCSPSKAENLGQPLVESQLCGLPLVTFSGFSFDFVSCPETAQQVPAASTETDDYGLVIPEADPEALAEAIVRARDVAESAGRSRITRDWAYEKFHHHNAARMVEAVKEYQGLIRSDSRPCSGSAPGPAPTPPLPDQAAVGDQGDAMVAGYLAAAERIEIEIGTPAGNVLDVGCNTGAGMMALAARWPEAVMHGLEPVPGFAQAAQGRGFQVQAGSAEAMPYPSRLFDLVFLRHSLEHVASRRGAMIQIRRVLKPGGHVYLQIPIEPGGSANALHLSPFRTAGEVRALGTEWREVYWGPQATVAELILEA